MAVKERKQITGTTAQINAYKGHEGQIVWDKEKKTLVGMSGTAGKNYPLAPKTYVDNEVAKVNTEVAKKQPKGDYATNAQLTAGLAGKEDKGTCLPLTGGKLTGSVAIKSAATDENVAGIYTEDNTTELQIVAGSKDHTKGGASLIFYGRNRVNEGGAFHLLSNNGLDVHDLHNDAQHLYWDTRYILNSFSDSQEGFIMKTGRGTGTIFGSIVLFGGQQNYKVNFPHPFTNGPVVRYSLQDNTSVPQNYVGVDSNTTFTVYFIGGLNAPVRVNYIASGETPW